MDFYMDTYITKTVVVSLEGEMNAFNASVLRANFERLFAEGVTRFIVNLTNITVLDSAGIAVLVNLLKRARQAHGDVKLVAPIAKSAHRMLKLTRFDRVFEMVELPSA